MFDIRECGGNGTATITEDELPCSADSGSWLVTHRRHQEMTEAAWLEVLGEFVASGTYLLDGMWSAAGWLALKCNMARSTAHEKVQVASELRRRPWLMRALAAGNASYSAIRAICRVNIFDEHVDQVFLGVAATGTIPDLERVIRHWQVMNGQDTPPPIEQAGYWMAHGYAGLGTATIDAPNDMLEELEAAIAAFTPPHNQDDGMTAAQRRLEGIIGMARTALAHARDGAAMGEDLYMCHVIADIDRLTGQPGRAQLVDGTPLDRATFERILCDCSFVTHITKAGTDPLFLGRKTHDWSTAQRRAITVRDNGHCRVPGCANHHVDIHHLKHWTKGGTTDVPNGALLCRYHHHMHHQGRLLINGNANSELVFSRADGVRIGATRPAGDPTRLFE